MLLSRDCGGNIQLQIEVNYNCIDFGVSTSFLTSEIHTHLIILLRYALPCWWSARLCCVAHNARKMKSHLALCSLNRVGLPQEGSVK